MSGIFKLTDLVSQPGFSSFSAHFFRRIRWPSVSDWKNPLTSSIPGKGLFNRTDDPDIGVVRLMKRLPGKADKQSQPKGKRL